MLALKREPSNVSRFWNIPIVTLYDYFVGVEIFNEDKPFTQINLQSLDDLKGGSGITSMCWTSAEKNEILVGRGDSVIRTFDAEQNQFRDNDRTIPAGRVVGLAFHENVIAASDNGKIHFMTENGEDLSAGDNTSRMRQSTLSPHLIAVGGQDRQNNVKVFDLNTKAVVFSSKNVPHDNLQLEVAVWDSDLTFAGEDLATCSRHGYVRYYDMRTQRRPALNHTDENRAFNSIAEKNGIIYVSTTTGGLFAFDKKNFKKPLHTYKGASGSILSIDVDETGKYLFTASLDRYVRVHNAEKTNLLYQCYVKSKASQILIKSDVVKEESEEDEEDAASDKEYNDMFEQMQKVEDDEPAAKKPKVLGNMKRHSGLRLPSPSSLPAI